MMQKAKLLASISLISLLTACGGGSGSAPQPVLTPPPPPPSAPPAVSPDQFRTSEYNRNWALEAVGAAEAYASGYTGEGVIIGVVDFNFLLSSGEVNYSADSRGRQQRWVDIYEAQIGDTASITPHGHSVSVFAAGVKNDTASHGLAYDAEVLAVDFFSGVDVTTEVQNGVTHYRANPYRYAVANGAKVVNKSLGYDEGDVITNPPVVSERFSNASDAYVVLDGGLLVSSAGNNGHNEPSLSNLDTIDILRENDLLDGPGAFIIVGAVDENNQIADFSDRAGAGESKNFFMVAPGVQVVSYWDTEQDGPGLYTVNGTSFSAPLVSAAAALIWQRWPKLTAREVRSILFDTATDLGAAGVDAVYGHGLLNVAEAVKAQGAASIATKSGQTIDAPSSVLNLPPIFGDAGNALRQVVSSVTIFDRYGRDFQMDLSGGIYQAPVQSFLATAMTAQQNWTVAGLNSPVGQLHYALSRDQSLMGDLRRQGLFGNQEKQAARQINAVMSFKIPLSQGGKGGVSTPDHITLGYGESLASVLTEDLTTQGRQQYRSQSLISPDFGVMNFASGPYALVQKKVSDKAQFSFGVSHTQVTANNTSQGFNQSYQGVGTNARNAVAPSQVSQFVAAYHVATDGSRMQLQLGYVQESQSLLGSLSSGAFGLSSGAKSAYVRGQYGFDVSDSTSIALSASVGRTQVTLADQSLVDQLDRVVTSAWQVRAVRQSLLTKGDQIRVTVQQPERVEYAPASVTVGAGVDWDQDQINFQTHQFSLTPSGREIAGQVDYSRPWRGMDFGLALAYRYDAGHIRGQQEVLSMLRLSKRF